MFLIQFAFRIDHLGFDPDTEFYSGAVGSTHQSADAIRQFGGGRLPIAKPRLVAAAGIFITEPTVIEQEHIDTEDRRLPHKMAQFLFIESKTGRLPVIQQRQARTVTVLELVVAGPIVKTARSLTRTLIAVSKDKLRRTEHFARTEVVLRRIRIDPGNHTQIVTGIYIERKTEITGPVQRPEHHLPFGLASRGIEPQNEKRRGEHSRPGAQPCIEHLLPGRKFLLGHRSFIAPFAGKLGQVIGRTGKIEQGRGEILQQHRSLLPMTDLRPCLNDVCIRKRVVIQLHLDRIHIVTQRHHRARDCGGERFLRMRNIPEQGRVVAVGMRHAYSRFEKILQIIRLVSIFTCR